MATGSPYSLAKAKTSLLLATGSAVPATSGAPTCAAIFRAETLSPKAAIAAGGGPTQSKPASITAWANFAFSERKP